MIKYAANAFLATKISFINEIAALSDKLGATIDDIRDGIALDPRIGPGFLRAGVGYGGSCFPKDVRALDYLALTSGHNFELLRSVITVNNRQRLLPFYALRQRFGSVSGLSVGVLGLAFKPHTDDVREAPSLDLIRVLADHGAKVRAFDPAAARTAKALLPSDVEITGDVAECARGVQALVLMTEWPQIVDADWEGLVRLMRAPRFLFDGRNALDKKRMLALGFEYSGVGRNGRHPG
jgi:UDPglucose 6-dehydrogenase